MSFSQLECNSRNPNWLTALRGLDNFCYSSFLSHRPHLPYSNYFPRGLLFGLPQKLDTNVQRSLVSITRRYENAWGLWSPLCRKGDKPIYHMIRNSLTLLCLITIVLLQFCFVLYLSNNPADENKNVLTLKVQNMIKMWYTYQVVHIYLNLTFTCKIIQNVSILVLPMRWIRAVCQENPETVYSQVD